jgi:putative tricarboxylic transport membrane protein
MTTTAFGFRSRALGAAVAVCALSIALGLGGSATAQGWKPQHAIEIIVGSTSGSSPDTLARAIARIWQEKKLVEQQANVVNRVGGGNTIAWNFLSKQAGNGHFLMVSNINLSSGYLTGTTKWSFRDFTSIGMLFHEYVALSVLVDSPIKDGRDLLARLKKDPAAASLGISTVAGGANHLSAGLVFRSQGIDVKKVRTVVFDSAGKNMTALLGGHIDVASTSITAALRQMQAGKTRVLGISGGRRLGGDLAAVPTWKEQGADVEFSNYRGFIAAPGVSAAQIAYWEGVLATLDKDESWREYISKNQLDQRFMNGQDARKYMENLEGPIKAVLGDLGLLKMSQ